jgi:hypothetical protein
VESRELYSVSKAVTIQRWPLAQADPTASSGISLAHRIACIACIASRLRRISAIPMGPPTSMMTPQIMKPVLKPSSAVF